MREILWVVLAAGIITGPATAEPQRDSAEPQRDSAEPQRASAEPQRVVVSRFGEDGLEGWEPHHFEKETEFRLVQCGEHTVVEAVSEDDASVLYLETEVDLEETPWLHWSWRVLDPLPPHPERVREGSDFHARIYVGFKGTFGFIGRHTLGYVWSTQEPPETHWKSPFRAAPVRFMAVRKGPPYEGWVREARNVLRDYGLIYDDDPREVRALGLMTDSDSYPYEEPRAVTQYADIYFSSSPEPTAPEDLDDAC